MDNHEIPNIEFNQRGKAWRRYQKHLHQGEGMGSKNICKPEKNWKHLYLRSRKLARAKQLGFEYPIKSKRQWLNDVLDEDT